MTTHSTYASASASRPTRASSRDGSHRTAGFCAHLARHDARHAARPHAAHLHRHPARRRRVRRLTNGHGSTRHTETVRINGNRTTNDGKIAVKWALDGHGILMCAERDLRDYLADGRLAVVLPDHEMPSADIYAVYAQRHQTFARIRAFVDFLAEELERSRGG
ncbi:LysR substrate-binding domain-containing protein [Burkholderia seminalis]|uniref:LysR substrate-binding domain-containing protein n=1 Tax=Burkholderia seminalis TaxID=488731 RepID=UPI00315987B9